MMVKRKVTNILGYWLALSMCPWYKPIEVAVDFVGSINAIIAATAFDDFDVVGASTCLDSIWTTRHLKTMNWASEPKELWIG